jgi:hypothetical protein
MLDTLMVLWTKGIYNRFLRLLCAGTLLCSVVGLLLFFMLFSGGKWPGRAATSTPATPGSTPTYVASLSSMPVILQNPRVPTATPTPVLPAPQQTALASSIAMNHSVIQPSSNTDHHIHTVAPVSKRLVPAQQPAPATNPAQMAPPDLLDPFSSVRNLLPSWLFPDNSNQLLGNTGKQFTASINANTRSSAPTNTLWMLSGVAVLILLFCLALLAARQRRLEK